MIEYKITVTDNSEAYIIFGDKVDGYATDENIGTMLSCILLDLYAMKFISGLAPLRKMAADLADTELLGSDAAITKAFSDFAESLVNAGE